MEKHIYNEQKGISYTLQGDYYLPDLALPEQENKPIGLWDIAICAISSGTKKLYTRIF